jgi:hypothetical protein
LSLTAEGRTQEEALANLAKKLEARLQNGILVPLELPMEKNPLAEFVGMFKDNPRIADWKKSMKAYRRKRTRKPASRDRIRPRYRRANACSEGPS